MSARQLSTGVAASCCLSLGALIAALILDSGHPLLQAVCVFGSCLLVLGSVAAVEAICSIEDDAVRDSVNARESLRKELVRR